MAYNLTNFTDNSNTYLEMVLEVNRLSGMWFSVGFLVTLWVILYMTFKRFEKDTKETLLVSSSITLFVSVLMLYTEMIGFKIFVYPLIATIGSLIVFKFGED